jgi:photosystem II stability/assembly factor-like uncharacterized protein
MKKQLITLVLLCMVLIGKSQFIQQPLNYPGVGFWPYYISISDPEHVWVGTIQESGLPYSIAVKTNDGGESWIFDSIPVPGSPYCTSICALDSNTCFYVFSDLTGSGGTIWKTNDGGNTWTNTITTQFIDGFANFYHAFSADTGIAMGDPTNGYFEIQLTNNGGSAWNRVPSANIPPPLSGEYGIADSYSAVGNSVWFATNKGRCFRSIDRGKNWNVTQVSSAANGIFDVCFSTEQNGAFWSSDVISSEIYVTLDGGVTWNSVTFPSGYCLVRMCSVAGFDGGLVFTAWKNFMDVYFTPDMFTTLVKIASNIISNGTIAFQDASTGWLAGGESGSNEIYKYNGTLSFIRSAKKAAGKLSIIPNPSSVEALVKLPSNVSGIFELRITGITGKLIDQSIISSTNEWTKLNVSDYENGIYLVEVLSGKNILAREKLIVNR